MRKCQILREFYSGREKEKEERKKVNGEWRQGSGYKSLPCYFEIGSIPKIV